MVQIQNFSLFYKEFPQKKGIFFQMDVRRHGFCMARLVYLVLEALLKNRGEERAKIIFELVKALVEKLDVVFDYI